MSRTLLVVLTFSSILFASRAEDTPPITVEVTTDGKPAAKARVWVYRSGWGEKDPEEPTPLIAGSTGKVSVPGPTEPRRERQVFARDDTGRIGWAWLSPLWDQTDASYFRVPLVATTPRAGRVTDADGKPVAGAVVTPTHFSTDRRHAPRGPQASIDLPPWEQARLAANTDAEGRFRIAAPADYSIVYRVKTRDAETKWIAQGGVELETKLFVPGTVSVSADGVVSAHLKGKGLYLRGLVESTPSSGVAPSRYFSATFGDMGKATFSGVVPGQYELSVDRDGLIPAVFQKGPPIDVAAGKTTTATAKFGPAAKATGTVIDQVTGKGLSGVEVSVHVTTGPEPAASREFYHLKTDADGKYAAHGSAGWYVAVVQRAPDGHSTPPPARQDGQVKKVRIETGKSHTFEAIALPRAVAFSGQVVGADGKPAAGATVQIDSADFTGGPDSRVATGKDGRFTLKNLPPDDSVEPRIRLGDAVNIPKTFVLEKTTGPVTFELSEANAAAFKGRVLDARGKPLAGAKVKLLHHVQYVGRGAQYSTYRPMALVATDSDGRYSFAGLWPRDAYHIQVAADGYAEAEGKQLTGVSSEVKEFADVRLNRASLAVSGIVVRGDGEPVAGAGVFGVDGPTRFTTTSAADGSFTLTGFYEGAGFVFAKKAGHRLAAIAVVPGGPERVTIALAKNDDPPNPPPRITVEHSAALDRFTRHALRLMWENHDTFGYGGSAIQDMARVDLTTARKWRDEMKERSKGKTDFTRLIDGVIREKTLLDTAKADIDEAIAIVSALKPDAGFTEAVRLGEQLLAVDKSKAARLAEEAVVMARQLDFPRKVWSLAQAGDLAARAGNAASGKKVLLEAADLAAKLTPDVNGHNSLAVGMVAARLAAHDWPRAEALLNSLTDPGDFNRYLHATVGRLARTDFPKAKELLTRFKPSNSSYPQTARLRVAFAVARTQPDEALKLIESVEKGPYRFQGFVRLAMLIAPTDKARAVKLIDTAYDLLDRDPQAFRSWSNYGDRAGVAAVGLVRAKEIGYPDLAGLVDRTLALRPTADEGWSPADRENNIVKIASALALVDPAAARHMLAAIAPPEEFVERALGQRREWLFALALADPERATTLADKLIERAKTRREGGRNPLSETGLVETCSILTSPDRLRDLTMYASLPREIGDDD